MSSGETSVDQGIQDGKKVAELSLNPRISATREALIAMLEADVYCVGPGSFYTSVLPNFLPDGIKVILQRSRAKKMIYIANLFTEGKGMSEMDLPKCIETVEQYSGHQVDWVVYDEMRNHKEALPRYAAEGKYPIRIGDEKSWRWPSIVADLWTDPDLARHDSSRLGHIVMDLINRCRRL